MTSKVMFPGKETMRWNFAGSLFGMALGINKSGCARSRNMQKLGCHKTWPTPQSLGKLQSWKGNWQTATPPTGGTSASVLPGASSGHHYTCYGCIFIILTFSFVTTALNCFNMDHLGQIGNNIKQFSYNTKLMANLVKNNISLRHLLPQSLKVPPCGFEWFQLVILLHQRYSLCICQ